MPIEIDPNQEGGLWDYAFNGFLVPSIQERIQRGGLPNPFPLTELTMFQVLFYPDGRKPVVRINTEVRGVMMVSPKPGQEIKAGQAIHSSDITSVSEVSLRDEDADCGHVTLVQLSGAWTGSFDFTRYKGKSRNALKVAKEYFVVAERCRKEKQWAVFVDTLWAAAELAAKAHLFYHDSSETVVKSKKHPIIRAQINRQRKIGNVADGHVETYNVLSKLRDKARYAEEAMDLEDAQAEKYLTDIRTMIDQVYSKVKGLID